MSAASKSPVARAWALIEALSGHTVDGLRLKQVADTVKQIPSTTLRDLAGLEAIGVAERIPGRDDCWRLARRIVQIAVAHEHEMARHRQRLDDHDRSYTRSPR